MQLRAARLLLLAMFGNLMVAPVVMARTGELTIEIEGLRALRGQVCLSLFSSSRGFPGEQTQATQSQCVKVGQNPVSATFRNLRSGSYAVAVIHDVNSDGTLNRNGLGVPTEGFGFSRNPKIRVGPPKFGDSVILVAGASTRVQIQLRYLLGG